MPEFPLQFASRQIRRTFERAIGKSVPKILTELITNSDDSYRRLENVENSSDKTDSSPIVIIFERSKKRILVIDRAEGLTDKEMEQCFVTYGKESTDRKQGFRTRSLFGKGLRDVLFTQHHGQVKSIKNDLFYNCQFRWKGDKGHELPVVDIKHPARVTAELRKAFNVSGNGTMVEFQLREDAITPRPEKLVSKLNNFYMLRMINSSPHRRIVLKAVNPQGRIVKEYELNYKFPEMEIVKTVDDELVLDDGSTVKIQGEIGLADHEMAQGEVGYEDREGGLLIVDEDDTVLDLCLFGYDEDPYARRIVGVLRVSGAGTYIRKKLNQEKPEEILSETRDGFDKNHPFFRVLRDQVRPHLDPIVEKLRKKEPISKSKLSDQAVAKQKQAFELLNKLYSEIMGKTGKVPLIRTSNLIPPKDGIEFINKQVTIQTDISTPGAMLLNTNMVKAGDIIRLSSDTPDIGIAPQEIKYDEAVTNKNPQIKIFRLSTKKPGIKGKIVAEWDKVRKTLDVETTEREIITPLNGLEFDRDEYVVRLGALRHLKLFVDTDKVPIGSEISFNVMNSAVRIIQSKITVAKEHLVSTQVAQVAVEIKGESILRETTLSANCNEYAAGAKVSVVKKIKEPEGKGGIFKDWKFESIGRKVQSLFDLDGVVLINIEDPVNKRYFGEEPYKAVDERIHCQVRLADLILDECLQKMVSDALYYGKMERRFPDNPETDIRNYVGEKKFEIGSLIHSFFVTKT